MPRGRTLTYCRWHSVPELKTSDHRPVIAAFDVTVSIPPLLVDGSTAVLYPDLPLTVSQPSKEFPPANSTSMPAPSETVALNHKSSASADIKVSLPTKLPDSSITSAASTAPKAQASPKQLPFWKRRKPATKAQAQLSAQSTVCLLQ